MGGSVAVLKYGVCVSTSISFALGLQQQQQQQQQQRISIYTAFDRAVNYRRI